MQAATDKPICEQAASACIRSSDSFCGTVAYRTIVADPPWQITMHMGAGGRRARATEVPYGMMTVDEIKALPVASLADEQAHLYLWTTRRYFREGVAVAVARAWGFEPCGE